MLGDTLRALAPYVQGDLVAADSLRRIAATVGRLPAAVAGFFGFECRLGDRAATADFACRVTSLHGGHAVLAGRSAAHAPPPAWREHPVWDRVGRFCQLWAEPTSALHADVRDLWLEFDVGQAPPPAVPLPSVFFGPPAARDVAAYGWLVERAIPLLRGAPLPPPTERTLRRCLDALPAAAWVRHVGLMLARPTDALRLAIRDLPFDSLPAFLDRVGWPGASDEAHAAVAPIARLAPSPKLMLSLDVGPRIGPRIGLECLVPAGPEWSSRRAAFLDYLVAKGLCVPAKRAALVAWDGWAHEPDRDAASPEHLAPLSDLVGLPVRGVFVPWLSHVKVSYQPDRPLEAKAYLAVHLRWKLI
jgi:hypothetical protein